MLTDYKQNLHTHSTFCDGKDTPCQMVEAAIRKGFHSIGFSGHSYMHFCLDYGMTPEGTKAYVEQIGRLKEEYAGKIEIFCGIEYDMYSQVDIRDFDYAIGSVHFLKMGGEYIDFDRSAEDVEEIIKTKFGGDGMAYARQYYETLSHLPEHGQFDIIGHFDLITKHMETRSFFDPDSPEYLSAAFAAAQALAGKIPYFEVNTGAIARGYRTSPYPAIPILRELNRLGFGAVITSDCHNSRMLDCYYGEAKQLLRECGFDCRFVLTQEGFQPVKL